MSGLKITWDKYALQIDGKKIFLIGGEFHYWRIPDPERWRDVLTSYKIAGLNCLRIYFHWGFHNIREGTYRWDGNRDVDALLKICEELGLFVFVASGPYICAETSAGGYPLWMVSRRDIRIKHLKGLVRQQYDDKYMEYCHDWWKNFIAQMKSHQITENPNGCVIGFQVENEYLKKMVIFKGSERYMRELVQYTHKFGITVPTFHDDGLPIGSWNGIVDLYAFNKYLIHAPKTPKKLPMEPWSISSFMKRMDKTEETVRSFGPPASETPIMVPELQGGWYNSWGIKYGYDELYNYYGAPYQKTLVESFAAQGSTIMTLYMFYGGTSYGAIGNPEVYTSYDYSACLREYGYQSERLRLLRLFTLFTKSFQECLAATDYVPPAAKGKPSPIVCMIPHMLYRHRQAQNATDFFFFRNFTSNGTKQFHITIAGEIRVPKEGEMTLLPRESLVAIGTFAIGGISLKVCTLPIIVQGPYADGALMIVQNNGGELLLIGTRFEAKGDIQIVVDAAANLTRVSFAELGMGKIITPGGKVLYLVCLSREDALTVNADFNNSSLEVAWGAYSVFFNGSSNLEIETIGKQEVKLLSTEKEPPGFEAVAESIVPGLKKGIFGDSAIVPPISLQAWARRQVPFDGSDIAGSWKEIDFANERDLIDHRFLSGHALYKCEFVAPAGPKLKLKINARHKAAIWLNRRFIGACSAYSLGYGKAGAVNGPDLKFGSKKFDLSPAVQWNQKNTLYVLTESLGQNKVFWLIYDVRNPRGILSANFSAPFLEGKWSLFGTDVTTVEDPYNISSLPGENLGFQKGAGEGWVECTEPLKIAPDDQVVWYKTQFQWHPGENQRIPLRVHLDGKANVNLFVNGLYIGRYWGEAGPQHDFYVMDGLLRDGANNLVLGCWTSQVDEVQVKLRPYKVQLDSGNIDEDQGTEFATTKFLIKL